MTTPDKPIPGTRPTNMGVPETGSDGIRRLTAQEVRAAQASTGEKDGAAHVPEGREFKKVPAAAPITVTPAASVIPAPIISPTPAAPAQQPAPEPVIASVDEGRPRHVEIPYDIFYLGIFLVIMLLALSFLLGRQTARDLGRDPRAAITITPERSGATPAQPMTAGAPTGTPISVQPTNPPLNPSLVPGAAQSGWFVQTLSVQDEAAAHEAAEFLRKAGYPATVRKSDRFFTVQVGPFASTDRATLDAVRSVKFKNDYAFKDAFFVRQ